MGQRKPVELRVLEGNPSKRRLPNTPKSAPLLADPPESLSPSGRELWCRVRDAFPDSAVVQESDRDALLALCEARELAEAALADLRTRGVIIESCRADRELVRNPAMLVWGAASERVAKGLASFGLTPLDRARFDIAAPEEEAEDPTMKAIRAATQRR